MRSPAESSGPPVIAWDIDDVLNRLTREWLEEFRAEGRTKASYEDMAENPPAACLGISKAEFLASLDSFRSRRQAALEPRPETLAWFKAHGDAFFHIAVSAVPMRYAPISAAWVAKHYGRWIRSFNFIPSPRPDDDFARHEANKAEMLARFAKVDLFIDDIEANLDPAKEAGFKTLVFPAPWNSRRGESEAALFDDLNRNLRIGLPK